MLDQATKFLVTRFLELYERVEVLPVLDFTLLHNTGAAFSILADASGWQRWFFIALGLVGERRADRLDLAHCRAARSCCRWRWR